MNIFTLEEEAEAEVGDTPGPNDEDALGAAAAASVSHFDAWGAEEEDDEAEGGGSGSEEERVSAPESDRASPHFEAGVPAPHPFSLLPQQQQRTSPTASAASAYVSRVEEPREGPVRGLSRNAAFYLAPGGGGR